MNTLDTVKKIIAELLDCEEESVQLESDIKEDLQADSLDAVEMIMSLEETFGVSVPTEKAEELKTVADIVRLVDFLKNS